VSTPIQASEKNDITGTGLPGGGLSHREMLFGLFFSPHTVLLAARCENRWRRALMLVTILSILCGSALGLMRLPTVYTEAVNWAGWFGETVGALWMKDGRLYWEKPETLPYTTRHDHWRVDFVKEGTEPDTDREKGPERRGVWISHDNVIVWWVAGDGSAVTIPLLQNGAKRSFVNLADVWPDGLRVPGREFKALVRKKLARAIPMFFVYHWVSVWCQVVLYALLFSAISTLLRGGFLTGGLKAAFGITLYASIPPLVVATVYAGLDIPALDFRRVFVVAFFVYLLMVFRGIRREAMRESKT
jgi:hypothetical protein